MSNNGVLPNEYNAHRSFPSHIRVSPLRSRLSDGIPGDSLNARHSVEIALTSYSQSLGGRNCSRVVANKILDSASPALFSSAATNVTIPTVIITLVKNTGSGSVDFFKATLDTVQIERIDLGDQNSVLVEQVVLRPRNIRIEYRTQDNAVNWLPPIVSTIACN